MTGLLGPAHKNQMLCQLLSSGAWTASAEETRLLEVRRQDRSEAGKTHFARSRSHDVVNLLYMFWSWQSKKGR